MSGEYTTVIRIGMGLYKTIVAIYLHHILIHDGVHERLSTGRKSWHFHKTTKSLSTFKCKFYCSISIILCKPYSCVLTSIETICISMCHTFLMSINVGMSGLFKQCVQQYITKTSVLAVNINHDPYLLQSINFVNYCTST